MAAPSSHQCARGESLGRPWWCNLSKATTARYFRRRSSNGRRCRSLSSNGRSRSLTIICVSVSDQSPAARRDRTARAWVGAGNPPTRVTLYTPAPLNCRRTYYYHDK